jgi:hypothetical protein
MGLLSPEHIVPPLEVADLPDDEQLRTMARAYKRELEPYLRENKPFWMRTLGVKSGTLTNIEQSASWGMSWLAARPPETPLERVKYAIPGYSLFAAPRYNSAQERELLLKAGCIPCQTKTYEVLGKVVDQYNQNREELRWVLTKIVVGLPHVLEHHSVAVHRQRTTFQTSYVFDPWIVQAPKIYVYGEWLMQMANLNILGEPRAE